MRSILRSTLLASFALSMTWGLSGCEDTTKTTPPAAPSSNIGAPGTNAGAPDASKDKMEPDAKDKMEPAPKDKMEPAPSAIPPVEKPADPPK